MRAACRPLDGITSDSGSGGKDNRRAIFGGIASLRIRSLSSILSSGPSSHRLLVCSSAANALSPRSVYTRFRKCQSTCSYFDRTSNILALTEIPLSHIESDRPCDSYCRQSAREFSHPNCVCVFFAVFREKAGQTDERKRRETDRELFNSVLK